jgi:beta-phosphoglucomutase-like phosphatase (HAD superfamily)
VLAPGDRLSERDYYARYLGRRRGRVSKPSRLGTGRLSSQQIKELVVRKAVRPRARNATLRCSSRRGRRDRRAAAALPIAIASGARGDEIRRVLAREELTACFTAIVAAGDTAVSKPAPDPYLRALALLADAIGGALKASECVAIEDSHWGLESARSAGMRTVAVTNTYAPDLLRADLTITSLADMDLDLLARLCSE